MISRNHLYSSREKYVQESFGVNHEHSHVTKKQIPASRGIPFNSSKRTWEKHLVKTRCIYSIVTIPMFPDIHPASRGVAAHTAGLFWCVTGAKGGVDHEDHISKE